MVCLSKVPNFELSINLLTCGMSCILSLLVVYYICKKSLFKVFSFRILTYISLNDFLRSLTGLLESLLPYNHSACLFYGYLDNYFYVSNMTFSLCLTFTIYQIIVLEEFSFEKYHNCWVIFSVFGSGFIAALPFITNSYGHEGVICQILIDEKGCFWRFFDVYTPLFIMLIIISILSYKVYKKVKILDNISFTTIVFERGLIYAIIISIVFIPFLIIRLVQIFYNGCEIENFIIILHCMYILQGSFNAAAFFNNKTIGKLLSSNYSIDRDSYRINGSLIISYSSDIN